MIASTVPPIAPTPAPIAQPTSCAADEIAAETPNPAPAEIIVTPVSIAAVIAFCFQAAIGKWSITLGESPILIIDTLALWL